MRPKTQADALNLKAVLIPSEHGASVMLAESLAAGLIIGSSPQGFIPAAGWVLVFFMSQPLKIAVKDISRGIFTDRTRAAVYYALLFGLFSAAAMAVGVHFSEGRLLWILGAVLTLGAVHLLATVKGGKKELAAELFGALSLGGAAASILVAAGMPLVNAFVLWGVLAMRAGTSVLYVRGRLRLMRRQETRLSEILLVHLLALAALTALVLLHALKPVILWAGLLLVARLLLLTDKKPVSAKIVGIQESLLGALYVVFVVWAF